MYNLSIEQVDLLIQCFTITREDNRIGTLAHSCVKSYLRFNEKFVKESFNCLISIETDMLFKCFLLELEQFRKEGPFNLLVE